MSDDLNHPWGHTQLDYALDHDQYMLAVDLVDRGAVINQRHQDGPNVEELFLVACQVKNQKVALSCLLVMTKIMDYGFDYVPSERVIQSAKILGDPKIFKFISQTSKQKTFM